MRNFKKIVIVAFLAYLPFNASAWGVLGHRIVGEVADHYINGKTRKAIQQILGSESIAMTANWADFVKSEPSYNYLGSWHYVNLPVNLSQNDVFSYLDNYPEANIYSKINEMVAILRNKNSTTDEKKLALRMVIHLVGDLHQPMHTARKDDLGGNKVLLQWFSEKTNLHRVWDSDLIDFQGLSFTEYTKAINHTTKQQVLDWQSTTLKSWVFESYGICNNIYATGIKNDDRLSFKYNYDWIEVANQQLLKGGVRLAGVLNSIYK